MRFVGRHLLEAFAQAQAEARPGLTLWLAAAEMASWNRPQRVLAEHPRASLIRGDLVEFRIEGNDYRLAARIDVANGIVRIVAVGTHAEYDRWRL